MVIALLVIGVLFVGGLAVGFCAKYATTRGNVVRIASSTTATVTVRSSGAMPTDEVLPAAAWPLVDSWSDDAGHSYRVTMSKPRAGKVTIGVGDGPTHSVRVEYSVDVVITNTSAVPAPMPSVGIGQAWPKSTSMCGAFTGLQPAWSGNSDVHSRETKEAARFCSFDIKNISAADPTGMIPSGDTRRLPSTMGFPRGSTIPGNVTDAVRQSIENPPIWFLARADAGSPRPWTSCLFDHNNSIYVSAATVTLPCHTMPEK